MAKDYGFKIAKPGKSINSSSKADILASSQFSMFKYHKDMVGTATIAPGETDTSVSFEHQLGYTPAFIAYMKDTSGNLFNIPSHRKPTDLLEWPYAYADALKIKCGYHFYAGAYNQFGYSDMVDCYDNTLGSRIGFRVGNGLSSYDGAVLFSSVTVPQGATISEAILGVAVGAKGAGAGNLEANIYGIDEDNTGDFSSNPMGRTRTSAVNTDSWSLPSAGQYSLHNVTSLVQEIVNRAGWASGNNMGFLLFNDSSPADVWIEDDIDVGIDTQLRIKYGSNATLTFRTIIFKNKIF